MAKRAKKIQKNPAMQRSTPLCQHPAFRLRYTLQGHVSDVHKIELSLDGRNLASCSRDGKVCIWDMETGVLLHTLNHGSNVASVAWSPDGELVASGTDIVNLWNAKTGKKIKTLSVGKNDKILNLAWIADNVILASSRRFATYFLDKEFGLLENTSLDFLTNCAAWSPNKETLAVAASGLHEVLLWSTGNKKITRLIERRKNLPVRNDSWSTEELNPDIKFDDILCKSIHDVVEIKSPNRDIVEIGYISSSIFDKPPVNWWFENSAIKIFNDEIQSNPIKTEIKCITWSPKGNLIALGLQDGIIQIWDVINGRQITTLETHTDPIISVCFINAGKDLVSLSLNGDLSIWQTDTWIEVARVNNIRDSSMLAIVSIDSIRPMIVSLGKKKGSVDIYDVDISKMQRLEATESVRYTTAKLVLVGDSGVGKTGLGWRLAHGQYKKQDSTHGQQFWVIDNLCTTRADGTQCEAVLWDLAGQHVYRPVHAIFLNDVDLSIVLFDPTNRQEPLKGVRFWLEQLSGKNKMPPSVLVGARLDCGASILSQQELDQFCQRFGISGGYIGTSAKSGEGLDELLETLKTQIHWDQMTTTVTTITFKRIKEYVLQLKEKPDRKGVLVNPTELRHQLQAIDLKWKFTDAELMTAVKHLENHGYVAVLRSSSGDQVILLTPELLVDLASSIVLQADKHPRELGALSETDLLLGRYPFLELKDLAQGEQRILLDAAVLRFIEHNICFRETLGSETLLIFPGLIKQKRPLLDEVEVDEDVSYIIRGRVENVYAALVVLLGYTPTFSRINQWQHQARYEMDKGEICGFRMIEEREGEIELVLYYSMSMPELRRKMFQGLFEQFLGKRDVEVTSYPRVVCPKGHLQARSTVIKRVRENKIFLFCDECGEKVVLPTINERNVIDIKDAPWIRREEALAHLRSEYEMHLVRVKGVRCDRAAPRCYISYMPEQTTLTVQLIHDLQDAGIYIIKNTNQVEADDLVIVVDTPNYQQSYRHKAEPIANDIDLIRAHLKRSENKRPTVIPLSGTGDFWQEKRYIISLFDLVLTLYAIPLNHPAFEPLRQSLRQQWEETLAENSNEMEINGELDKNDKTKSSRTRNETSKDFGNDIFSDTKVDFLLVTAIPEERDAVLAKLPRYRKLQPFKDDIRTYFQAELSFSFPDGETGIYNVIVMPLLEMGRVQAATATTDAIARWKPRYIVMIGIAGGVAAQGVRIGDILISNQIVDYELQKITQDGQEVRWDVQRADPRLLTACNNFLGEIWQGLLTIERPEEGKSSRHTGPIASGDKVLAFGKVLEQYRKTWPKLIGVEMEAAGVATAAFQSSDKPGFFMVRCASDLADEHKDSADVQKWRRYACDAAASFAIALLESGPIPLSRNQ